MDIKINIDGLDGILEKLSPEKIDTAVQKGVSSGGKIMQGGCKALCPVATGELRNSINENTNGGGGCYTSTIGTNKEYAIYVEKGTGIHAGGRQTPWRYQGSNGQWYTTKGQPPQPFMEPGVEMTKDEAIQTLVNNVKEAIG